MNKKQALVLGAVAVGLSTTSMASSFLETLNGLSSERVTAARMFCPYGECSIENADGSVNVRLTTKEENDIANDLATLNGLNILTGAALKASIARPETHCYNLVCPDTVQRLKEERRARAGKLNALVEAAQQLGE